MTFLVISFIAGVLTVLAPCILPLLPVVIGSSMSGRSWWTPYIVVGSLAASVIVFTFILKVSTAFIAIPPEVWSYVSAAIVALFGVTLALPGLWERIPGLAKLSAGSNKLVGSGYQKKSVWGDVIIGAALGPVFSTCSPTYFVILASVLPASFLLGTTYLLAYVLGLSLMLLLIAVLGERFVGRLNMFANPHSWFKRGLGVLFILVGLFIAFGFDKKLQTIILDAGFFDVTKIEQMLLMDDTPAGSFRFHEIVNPSGFVNTDGVPITIGEYVGKKVILLDIMTYSCINCQRSFPYVTKWYEEYKDDGFVVIGIHTPEFAFEKDIQNVSAAMQKFGINFPVVLDNDYATWNAYGNRYWPRKYLIDINGSVVYDHIGEGAYDETEAKIVELLNERKRVLGEEGTVSMMDSVPLEAVTVDFDKVRTRETYLGSARSQFQDNVPEQCANGVCQFQFTKQSDFRGYELSGAWTVRPEYISLAAGAPEGGPVGSIRMNFEASTVNLVMGAPTPVRARVLLDDVIVDEIVVQEHTLYKLIDLKGEYGAHILEIQFLDPGVDAYAFTFG